VAQSSPAAEAAPAAPTPLPAPAKTGAASEIARSYFDALAARDAGAAARMWRDDGVADVIPLRIFRGAAAIRSFLEEMFSAMPDARFSTERIVADDTAASVHWRLVGTFSGGQFQGLEPTDRRVELRGNDLLEVEDGKLVRVTAIFDGAAFARQVGLLPPEDSGADKAIRAGFNAVTKLRRTVAGKTGK
jgi:steroid delta-isomerase-like uncharacterized protein